jgi:phosphonate metabolism protein PhnN/1,5-bisphosphokinase (PRPP-forming)
VDQVSTLFLVVGPSGAGKDSLMDGARAALADEPGFVFAQRVVTRPAAAGGESHRAMTAEEFDDTKAAGAFLLSWAAHGLQYGISREVLDQLRAGSSVVANVSRGVIDEACRLYHRVVVILVTAPPEILARRLAARGRETEADIAERLRRTPAADPAGADVRIIINDRSLAEGVAAFIKALRAG